MSATRRAAPYASVVNRLLKSGRSPNVFLFTGPGAWKRAARRESAHGIGTALVLPAGADPAAFGWPELDSVVLDATGLDGTSIQRLIAALVRDGTKLVAICDSDRSDRFGFVRGAA